MGDDEHPRASGPVELPGGRKAIAVDAGYFHTCALLEGGQVSCWGQGEFGQLGYGDDENVGDDETPASVGPVDLGPGRKAIAISAGFEHTCALLEEGGVLCWGKGQNGRLGYGSSLDVFDPSTVDPIRLDPPNLPVDIAAGGGHTCALMEGGWVRCWGTNVSGQLGYANDEMIGDDEHPAVAGPVKLGARARGISTGFTDTCALLNRGRIRCWGNAEFGHLGYGNTDDIGDDEVPAAAGPVDLGARPAANAVAAEGAASCALLESGRVRCWGFNFRGELGLARTDNIGDDELPSSVGPVIVSGQVPTRLSLKVERDDDGRSHRYALEGTLSGPFTDEARLCEGSARLTLRLRGRTLDRSRARLEPTAEDGCAYRGRLRTRKEGRLKLQARFPGTRELAPASARRRVRAG